jgi:hypothetical protein
VKFQVKLSRKYRLYIDSTNGPLQPGEVGRLLENDFSDKPYLVEAADGRMGWYELKAIVKAFPAEAIHCHYAHAQRGDCPRAEG